MQYFNLEFIDFFKSLECNNRKDWFQENRKTYEREVREPFKLFAKNLTEALQVIYINRDLSGKTSISRINRDIRFGIDKTPYKTHMACMIMPDGRKDRTRPGFYLQANHKDIRVYSGSHHLNKSMLEAVRSYMLINEQEFTSIINNIYFKTVFGEIQGERHKKPPLKFRELEKVQPLIANKNFYWFFKLDKKMLTSPKLIEEIVNRFQACMPLNNFFDRALDTWPSTDQK